MDKFNDIEATVIEKKKSEPKMIDQKLFEAVKKDKEQEKTAEISNVVKQADGKIDSQKEKSKI